MSALAAIHMLLPLVGKMMFDVIFWGQKRTLGGPFGLQSALLFIFLKNFSQCQGDARGIGKTLREIWGSIKDSILVHTPP